MDELYPEGGEGRLPTRTVISNEDVLEFYSEFHRGDIIFTCVSVSEVSTTFSNFSQIFLQVFDKVRKINNYEVVKVNMVAMKVNRKEITNVMVIK